jgi:hypothetical protein
MTDLNSSIHSKTACSPLYVICSTQSIFVSFSQYHNVKLLDSERNTNRKKLTKSCRIIRNSGPARKREENHVYKDFYIIKGRGCYISMLGTFHRSIVFAKIYMFTCFYKNSTK